MTKPKKKLSERKVFVDYAYPSKGECLPVKNDIWFLSSEGVQSTTALLKERKRFEKWYFTNNFEDLPAQVVQNSRNGRDYAASLRAWLASARVRRGK